MSVTALSPAAADALRAATATEDRVILSAGQLDRKVYEEVNQALTRIGGGGKWNRRHRAHLFPRDPRPELAVLVDVGEMPVDAAKLMSYFRTPEALADELVGQLDLNLESVRLLEPSAGDGSIVRALRRRFKFAWIDAVEVDGQRAAQISGATRVHIQDFAEFASAAKPVYDAVVMNPPFTVPGNRTVYVEHIALAWGLLRPGGRLLAIAPNGLCHSSIRKVADLRERIELAGGAIVDLPDDAFQESGTSVRTVLVDVPAVDR